MKQLAILLLIILPLYSIGSSHFEDGCCSKQKAAGGKCTGSASCTACKNCSGCKHCSSGGTCGVCAAGKPKRQATFSGTAKPAKGSGYGQCQGMTRKGTQCSRKAGANGYCWQHEG